MFFKKGGKDTKSSIIDNDRMFTNVGSQKEHPYVGIPTGTHFHLTRRR